MNFEEVQDPQGNMHIIIDLGDGAYKSFPADPANPEYVAFLEAQETAN